MPTTPFRQFKDLLKKPGYLSKLDVMRIRKAAEGNTEEDFKEYFECSKAGALRIIGFWEIAQVELWGAEIIKRFFHTWIYEDRDMVAAQIHAAQLNGRLPVYCTPEIGLQWLESHIGMLGEIPQWVRANVRLRDATTTAHAETATAVPPPGLLDFLPAAPVTPAWAATPEAVVTETVSDSLKPDKTKPLPLTTNEIANCFNGFREWDVKRWKRELGSPDKWLRDCQNSKGTRGRGGYESTWWPVKIALALANKDQKFARFLPSRFQKLEKLKPWLEELENNIPVNFEMS